jgi:hypothetical protein
LIVFPYQSNLQFNGRLNVGGWTIDPLLGGTSAATTLAWAGPTSGTVGIPTSNFTASLNGIYTGTATPSDSGAGGTFTPSTLTWVASAASEHCTYTPAEAGTIPISITASPSLTISGSPIELVVTAGPGVINVFVDPRQGTILQ